MKSKFLEPIKKQEIRKTIDDFTEGVYCHSRSVGEKVIPMHYHENKYQLMYTEGKCVRIYYQLKEEVRTLFVPARHFAWVPKGVSHSVEANHSDFVMTSIFYINVLEGEFYNNVGVYAANNLLIELLNYVQDWDGIVLRNDEKKYSALWTIMCILADSYSRRLPIELPVAKHDRLQQILNFLQDQLNEQINIGMIANKFGFSERSLQRLFQTELNLSYAHYLKTLRVVRAIELLSSTDLSINEIAYKVGYESFPTFSNTFLEVVGVRPKVYRK